MKISVSIYANDSEDSSLEELVKCLDDHGVDILHVDCLDDPRVFENIKRIRSVSDTPIDLHIITPNPSDYYQGIDEHEVDFVAFQHESLAAPECLPSSLNTTLGVAFSPETPTSAFAQYAEQTRFALFMATTPGKSGGVFDKRTFQQIRRFRRAYPDKRIHVDGGVNQELSFILRSLGVAVAVSGSYVFGASSIGRALTTLRSQNSGSK